MNIKIMLHKPKQILRGYIYDDDEDIIKASIISLEKNYIEFSISKIKSKDYKLCKPGSFITLTIVDGDIADVDFSLKSK